MYYIKLIRKLPGLDDLYLTQVGARRIRGIGPFEFACYPLRAACKGYKSPAAAIAALAKLGYADATGAPLESLTTAGVTAVEIVGA